MKQTTLASIATLLVASSMTSADAKDLVDYASDARDYAISPAHWDRHGWALAATAAAATAAAYTVDLSVKHDFASKSATPQGDPHSLRDAAPMAALTLGTIALGALRDDGDLRGTGYDMVEAAALGTAGAFALKHAIGRQRPDTTDHRGAWRSGGDSLPSGHTTAMFAVAQVLADSRPSDEWGWRTAAYGLGIATGFARLDGNMHWLSDTVAGASLGIATGRFVSNHSHEDKSESALQFSVQPMDRGAALSFSVDPYRLLR